MHKTTVQASVSEWSKTILKSLNNSDPWSSQENVTLLYNNWDSFVLIMHTFSYLVKDAELVSVFVIFMHRSLEIILNNELRAFLLHASNHQIKPLLWCIHTFIILLFKLSYSFIQNKVVHLFP